MHGWTDRILGDVLTLQRGFDLAERLRVPGHVPIVSSSGVSGYHSVAKVKAPGVVTGRYGTLGEVFYVDEDFWPLNTTLWVKDFKGNHPRFVSFLLQTLNWPIRMLLVRCRVSTGTHFISCPSGCRRERFRIELPTSFPLTTI
jgi:hypothetical protein